MNSRKILADEMGEDSDLAPEVYKLFHFHKYLYYHTKDSRGSQRGFPDCIALGPTNKPVAQWSLFIVELKKQNKNATEEQKTWLTHFIKFSNLIKVITGRELVKVRLWRPLDLLEGKIESDIKRGHDIHMGGDR